MNLILKTYNIKLNYEDLSLAHNKKEAREKFIKYVQTPAGARALCRQLIIEEERFE